MDFVLSDEETRPFEPSLVWVGDIDPKVATNVLKSFDKHYSVRDLMHLKRIRRVENEQGETVLCVILAMVSAATESDLAAFISSSNLAVSNLRQVGVSKWPPLTLAQYHAWKDSWPMYWRESAARKDPMSDVDRKFITGLMRELCNEAGQTGHPTSCSAAVAFDPATKRIVARAVDTRTSTGHPLAHAAMNLIAAVAAANQKSADDASAVAVDESSDSGTVSRKRRSADALYMCTGLTVVLTHEPCIMCSMALLHSRVGGVVYGLAAPRTGGMGSVVKVHTERGLNHKFLAWRRCAEERVRQVFGEVRDQDWHY
ncbi:cytidine deaminase-like protein [Catenaria anguillulae PL171]|uniref:Cytidine deaminase-like protein n=1 Tax=Catenaria anguillulae PL171 TaxID=765915 RepID=A0A1Y2HR25_9FUNG|nr:cytidine deaminase-like protein [Catenaria anguillulae PL171]